MKEECSPVAIACALSDAQLRARETMLIAQFKSAVIATEDLPNGYAFRICDNRSGIALAAELMAAERECCPFLTFQLIAEPNKGPVTLHMTGPAGAKDFVRTIFTTETRRHGVCTEKSTMGEKQNQPKNKTLNAEEQSKQRNE